jgi:hypothetical protein
MSPNFLRHASIDGSLTPVTLGHLGNEILIRLLQHPNNLFVRKFRPLQTLWYYDSLAQIFVSRVAPVAGISGAKT